jgi:hypothetical protein
MRLETMWNQIIKRGEKVEVEPSRAERKLLLTGIVYLPSRVDEEIRSTAEGAPVKISLSDLDNQAEQVAGEANHAKADRRTMKNGRRRLAEPSKADHSNKNPPRG